ncbi:MAG: hypothetical protein HC904_02280 [Blastochloris sp.]|nr:hypothetical protein [Blastochloris sp.]
MNIRPLLLFPLLLLAACGTKNPNDPKFVVAKVDGEKITRADLDAKLNEVASRFGQQLDMLTPEQKEMLDWQLVNEMVNEQIISKAATQVKDPEVLKKVEEEFAKIKESAGDEKEFAEKLLQAGLTEEKLKLEMTKQAAMQHLVETTYAKELTLAPDAAALFYKEHPESFDLKEMVMARHILVLADKNTASKAELAAAKAKAEAARKEVLSGKSFEEVAQAVSEDPGSKDRGGALPPFAKGRMVPAFEQVAFSSQMNKVSPVFQTDYGYHFLEVLDKRPARKVSLEEAAPRIEQKLLGDKREESARKLIDDLRAKAKITLFIQDPAAQTATPASSEKK